MRERAYINRISQRGDSIYWLEENKNVLVAAALVEHEFNIDVDGINLINVGCFVSAKPGTMERILDHIWQDIGQENIYTMCRPLLADSLGLVNHRRRLVKFTSDELMELYPALAEQKTSYFNTSKQSIYQSMKINQCCFYIQLKPESVELLRTTNPKFIDEYESRLKDLEI
ncbi:MAG: hypothetical protein OHK0017_04400 [Patescibacteria group bacterium]